MITEFLMEGPEESLRLDRKTNPDVVKRQALWGGLQPGMRIADLGCGPGRTTSLLNELVQPNGEALGIDFSSGRIEYAREHYHAAGLRFECRDARERLDDLGLFDFDSAQPVQPLGERPCELLRHVLDDDEWRGVRWQGGQDPLNGHGAAG